MSLEYIKKAIKDLNPKELEEVIRNLDIGETEVLLHIVREHINSLGGGEILDRRFLDAFGTIKVNYGNVATVNILGGGKYEVISITNDKYSFNHKLFKFMVENNLDCCTMDVCGFKYKIEQFNFDCWLGSDNCKVILNQTNSKDALECVSEMGIRDYEVRDLVVYSLSEHYDAFIKMLKQKCYD